jgi:ABC-type tungstate transport system permease subunit
LLPFYQMSAMRGQLNGRRLIARVDRSQSNVSEIDLYKVVDTPRKPEAPSPSGMPAWYISIPAGFVALIATLRVIKALRRSR